MSIRAVDVVLNQQQARQGGGGRVERGRMQGRCISSGTQCGVDALVAHILAGSETMERGDGEMVS